MGGDVLFQFQTDRCPSTCIFSSAPHVRSPCGCLTKSFTMARTHAVVKCITWHTKVFLHANGLLVVQRDAGLLKRLQSSTDLEESVRQAKASHSHDGAAFQRFSLIDWPVSSLVTSEGSGWSMRFLAIRMVRIGCKKTSKHKTVWEHGYHLRRHYVIEEYVGKTDEEEAHEQQ